MLLPDILAIGEILIDFIPSKIAPLKDLDSFQKCPGGAPANFAVGIAKLGLHSGFIGKVGNDPFGKFLIDFLEKSNVDTRNIIIANEGERTTLAFVYYDEKLDRDFFFYRNNSADIKLQAQELKSDYFVNSKFLHFGSVSLTHEPSRSAIFQAIDYCKKNGGKISFDPNIRLDLWKDEKSLRKILKEALDK
ncbi:MAG: carbohydrate kinase, partial [Candidatus Thorarchaeota archaeon]